MQVLPEDGRKNAFHFAVNKNQIPISIRQIFSIHNLFMPTILDLLTKNKC